MNKIFLTGRMTKDVAIRTLPSGIPEAKVVLAVDRPFLNFEGKRDADFIPIIVRGKSTEYLAKYCKKTSSLLVEGRLQIRNFDAKDGTKHWVVEVIANHFEILASKPKENPVEISTETIVETTETKKSFFKDEICDDDIPW